MSGSTPPFSPIDEQAYVVAETTYDTSISNSGASSFGVNELKLVPERQYHPSKQHLGTASLVNEILGISGGKWSGTFYMQPVASATRPDADPFISAAFGAQSTTSPVTWTFAENITLAPSMQISRSAGNALYEVVNGAIVEKLEAEIVGNQEPVFKASGGFASYAAVRGQPITNSSTYSSSATSITLAASSAFFIIQFGNAQPRIAFGAENNAGAGYAVTAVDSTGLILTISPGLANGIGASQTITPVLPAFATHGTILGGVSAGLTIDSNTVAMISAKIAIETGFSLRNKEATSNRPTGTQRGLRKIDGDISFYALADSLPVVNAAWNTATHNVVIRAGANVSGARLLMTIPNLRFDVTEIPLTGEKDAAVITGKFMGRQNASHGDEMNWVAS